MEDRRVLFTPSRSYLLLSELGARHLEVVQELESWCIWARVDEVVVESRNTLLAAHCE
jgi:hypothetical protein